MTVSDQNSRLAARLWPGAKFEQRSGAATHNIHVAPDNEGVHILAYDEHGLVGRVDAESEDGLTLKLKDRLRIRSRREELARQLASNTGG